MNDTRQTPMSFKLAVIATLLMPLAGLVYAIADRNWGMLAMALFWLVIYATLGYLALEGSDLARWVSCALMLGTAILIGIIPVAPHPVARGAVARVGGGGSSSVGSDPWGVIIVLFFGLVAMRLALRPLSAAE